MDCNGQKFHLLAAAEHFALPESGNCVWDNERRVLRLASRRRVVDLPLDRTAAARLADGPPMTLDVYQTWATVNPARDEITAAGAFSEPVVLFRAPAGSRILDLSMSHDDVLYCLTGIAGVSGSVVMLDRRERWRQQTLDRPGFVPERICALADGSALVLDRRNRKLLKLVGRPLPYRPRSEYLPGTGRPCREDPEPSRLIPLDDNIIPAAVRVVAMAAGGDGSAALLLWPESDKTRAELLIINEKGVRQRRVRLAPAGIPFSVGWAGPDNWALLYENQREALVFPVPVNGEGKTVASVHPAGDRYPLSGWDNRPFCNAPCLPVCYPGRDGETLCPRPLHRLSLPTLVRRGEAGSREIIDSRSHDNAWHRIYLEAVIPAESSVTVFLSAANTLEELESASAYPHHFGSLAEDDDMPRGAWVAEPSELPFHQGLTGCPLQKDISGLFTCLVQRAGRKVRTLRGRYLQVKLVLRGNGHAGPRIAGLRIYSPRFSYLDRYLPELYREDIFGPEADTGGAATGSDFLQRFLCLFEGILTPLEDRVAASWMVTDPDSAPAEALDWLAGWIGLTLFPALSEARKRWMIRQAVSLYRQRGTIRGLSAMLDIATGDLVSRGKIIILEDFRLRRVFATILGADLEDEENPLLARMVAGGNSYLGDTLFLGDEEKKEFLALFRAGTAESAAEKKAVSDLYESTANRITVLAGRETDAGTMGIVRRLMETEVPAHVKWKILRSSKALMIGLASLVGIDTRPGILEQPQPVKVGASFLGSGDFILATGSLDPRLEGSAITDLRPGQQRPRAEAGETVYAEYGVSFTLSANGSQAYNSREIDSYIWKLIE